MKKILLTLFVLFAGVFATNVNNAHYLGTGDEPSIYFDTDMQFTTDYTLRLISGEVSSGDPNDLQSGDTVCSGATVRVEPSVNAKWATPDFASVALYYTCYGGYCPPMSGYGAVNSNRNIAWIASSTWNTENSFGDGNDYSTLSTHYDNLGPSNFYNQPVTYTNASGTFYNSKEGGAGVFCKGSFQVLDGATVKSTTSMPSVGNVDFAVTSAGAHQISTRLSDVECFASVVKHPLNIPDNPAYFLMTFYTHNKPSIGSAIATKTISLNVETSGGDCAFNEVLNSVIASSSLTDEDQIMVKATMHNSGDPIQITGVSSSNAGFPAMPFPVGICDTLGFPPSLCPASNGFGETINSGANKDLYVLIVRGAGASGGTVLTYNAQTASATCGSAATCSDTIDLGSGVAVTCDIDPAALTYGTNEVAEFLVTCENLAGDPIPCTGSNWYWADGLAGGFIEATNTHAWAYPTSPPGSSGTLRYRSGIAMCLSDIDVVSPTYECEFIPPSATMNVSTSEYFELNCFESGTQSTPDDAEYDPINGLGGSTSNSSTDGTTYNAPGSPDSGDLRGFAEFLDAPGPILGAVAIAPITVINGSDSNGSNDTNDTGGDPTDPGSTQWCTIGSGPLNVFPGYYGWVGIMCGSSANTTCTGVSWTSDGEITLSGSSNGGTYFTVGGDPGSSGMIIASVDGDPTHVCYKQFFVLEPECWEYS